MDVIELDKASAGEILTLQRAAFALDCAVNFPGYTAPVEQTLAQLREEMEKPDSRAFGIRDAHRLVAAVRIRRTGQESVYLGRLSVAPDRQGEGLGGTLLQAVHTAIPGLFPEAVRIDISVEGDNTPLVDWYRKRGYVVTREGTERSEYEWTMARPIA